MIEENKKSIIQSRFKNLFEFLKAYNDIRTPVICDISKQITTLWLNSLPKHPSVKLNEYFIPTKKETEEDGRQENDVLLEITRPNMTPCPKPPEILSDWLLPGWTKISNEAEVRKSKNVVTKKYFYPPVHRQRVYSKDGMQFDKDLPETNRIAQNALSLQLWSDMDENLVKEICSKIREEV